MKPKFIDHSDHITDYDKAHLSTYLEIFDRDAAGQSHLQIAQEMWGTPLPDRAEDLVKDHLVRAEFMTRKHLAILNLYDGPPIDEREAMEEFLKDGHITQEDFDNYFDPDFTGTILYKP